MLPDFLALKRLISEDRLAELRSVVRNQSIVSEAGEIRQHEGDRFIIKRADGSVSESGFHHVEVEATVNLADLLKSGTQPIRDALATMAEGLVRDQAETFRKVMDEACESAGTVTHAKGRPFTAELYIEALEPVEFTFDPDGRWNMPTLVMHPDNVPRVQAELARLDSEPELHARLTAMVDRKRELWRAREANRVLAD